MGLLEPTIYGEQFHDFYVNCAENRKSPIEKSSNRNRKRKKYKNWPIGSNLEQISNCSNRVDITANASKFAVFSAIRSTIVEFESKLNLYQNIQDKVRRTGQSLTKSLENDTDGESLVGDVTERGVAIQVPQIVGAGLKGLYELIAEARHVSPSLCTKALKALLDIIHGQVPESFRTEPCDLIQPLYDLLLNLATLHNGSAADPSDSVASWSAISCSALLGLCVACGDTGKTLKAIAAILMSPKQLHVQHIQLPMVMSLLQNSIYSVALGKPVKPDFYLNGIPINSLIDRFSLSTQIQQKIHYSLQPSIASNGKHIYILHGKCLFKVGSGFNGSLKGHIYAANNEFCKDKNGWIGFCGNVLYYKKLSKRNDSIGIVNLDTLCVTSTSQVVVPIMKEEQHRLLFSDGESLYAICSLKEDNLVVRQLFTTGPAITDLSLQLARKSFRTLGYAVFEEEILNQNQIQKMQTTFSTFEAKLPNDQELQMIVCGKEFGLICAANGKTFYYGKAAALGLKSTGKSPTTKITELIVSKSSNIVHIAIGHEGIHAVLVNEDGTVYFTGTARRGEDGDSSKNRRQPKALKPKKINKLDSQVIVYASCNNGTSAFVSTTGKLIMFGKDTAHCDASGYVSELQDQHITRVALGKAHCIALNNRGQIFSFGLNNKGQCGHVKGKGIATAWSVNNAEMEAKSARATSKNDTAAEDMCDIDEHNIVHGQCRVCAICRETARVKLLTMQNAAAHDGPNDEIGFGEGGSCSKCGACSGCISSQESQDAIEERENTFSVLVRQKAKAVNASRDIKIDENFHGVDMERDTTPRVAPLPPQRVVLPTTSPVIQIACGVHHTVCLTQNGEVYTFGSNQYGQLGSGDLLPHFGPIQVKVNAIIVHVAAGSNHTVLLTSKGVVYTFGSHQKGQLGRVPNDGSQTSNSGDDLSRAYVSRDVMQPDVSTNASLRHAFLWNCAPVPVFGIGPEYGRRATHIFASGDQTFLKIDESLLTGAMLSKVNVVANKSTILLIPQIPLSFYCLSINRRDGSCNAHTYNQVNFAKMVQSNVDTITRLASDKCNQNIEVVPTTAMTPTAITTSANKPSIDLMNHSVYDKCNQILDDHENVKYTQQQIQQQHHHRTKRKRHDSQKMYENYSPQLAFELDPWFGMLLVFDGIEKKISYYNIIASEISPKYDCNGHLKSILTPEIALPQRSDMPITRNVASVNLLACLDILTTLEDSIPTCFEQASPQTNMSPKELQTQNDFQSVSRFDNFGGGWGYSGHSVEAIRFMADTDILLLGFGMFGGRGEYTCKLKLFDLGADGGGYEKDGNLLSETEEIPYECAARSKYNIMLPKPILIYAGRWYLVWARIAGPSSDCGSSGQSSITSEDQIIFNFKTSKKANNGTDVNSGQIPSILYRVITQESKQATQTSDVEPVCKISHAFANTVTKDCFQSLIDLLRGSWKKLKAALNDLRERKSAAETMATISHLHFVAKVCLRLLRKYTNEIYPNVAPKVLTQRKKNAGCDKTDKQNSDLPHIATKNRQLMKYLMANSLESTNTSYTKKSNVENLHLAECVGEVRSLLTEILCDDLPHYSLERDPDFATEILNECHTTFLSCFNAFYPTSTLKWNCLCDLLMKKEKGISHSRLLSAVLAGLCNPNVNLKTTFSLLSSNRESLPITSPSDNSGLPMLSSTEGHQYPVLVEQITYRTQIEKSEYASNTWTFNDVLIRLLEIVSSPIRSEIENIFNKSCCIDSALVNLNQSLIDNCCLLLARVLSEIVEQSCSHDAEIASIPSQSILSTGSRFGRHDSCRTWNTGNFGPDAISFSVDRPGIAIAGAIVYSGTGSYDFQLELLYDAMESEAQHKWETLESISGTYDQEMVANQMAEIKFDRPVHIKENARYAMRLCCQGARTCSGDNGFSNVRGPCGATFSFYPCELSFNGTTTARGQLPCLLYYSSPFKRDSANSKIQTDTYARETALKVFSDILKKCSELLVFARNTLAMSTTPTEKSLNSSNNTQTIDSEQNVTPIEEHMDITFANTNIGINEIPTHNISEISAARHLTKRIESFSKGIIETLKFDKRPTNPFELGYDIEIGSTEINPMDLIKENELNYGHNGQISKMNGNNDGQGESDDETSELIEIRILEIFQHKTSSMFNKLLPLIFGYIASLITNEPKSSVQILNLIRDLMPHVAALNKLSMAKLQANGRGDGKDGWNMKSSGCVEPCIADEMVNSDVLNISNLNTTSNHYCVVESEHPYKSASITNFTIEFPPCVQWFTIEFDPQSGTAQPEDSLLISIPKRPRVHSTGQRSTTDSTLLQQPFDDLATGNAPIRYNAHVTTSTQSLKDPNNESSDDWYVAHMFNTSSQWTHNALILPGNTAMFSLETASCYAREQQANKYGFKCLVIGFDNPALLKQYNFTLNWLECELAYLGGACSSNLIKKELVLPGDNPADDYSMVEDILKEHIGLLSKGLVASESVLTIGQALDSYLPNSGQSKERQFLKDFVNAAPCSSGARLAAWLQPESRLDPSKCELLPLQEPVTYGWPTQLAIITRDQYGDTVYVPNLKIQIKAVPSLNGGCGNRNIKRLSSTDSNYLKGIRPPPRIPFEPTKKDKMCFKAITFMKAYQQYSFEELRYCNPPQSKNSEILYAQDLENLSYGTVWTPNSVGNFCLVVTIDGVTLEDVHRVEVKEANIPPPPKKMSIKKNQPTNKLRKFITKNSAGLRIRSHPTLQSEQVGVLKMGGIISFIDELENDDGIWVRLSTESIRQHCQSGWYPLEAWCLQYNQHIGKTLLHPVIESATILSSKAASASIAESELSKSNTCDTMHSIGPPPLANECSFKEDFAKENQSCGSSNREQKQSMFESHGHKAYVRKLHRKVLEKYSRGSDIYADDQDDPDEFLTATVHHSSRFDPKVCRHNAHQSSLNSSGSWTGVMGGGASKLQALQKWFKGESPEVREQLKKRSDFSELAAVSVRDLVRAIGGSQDSRGNGNGAVSPTMSRSTSPIPSSTKQASCMSGTKSLETTENSFISLSTSSKENIEESRSNSPPFPLERSSSLSAQYASNAFSDWSPNSQTNIFERAATIDGHFSTVEKEKEKTSFINDNLHHLSSYELNDLTNKSATHPKRALPSCLAESFRAVFAAFMWHEGIVHDAMACSSFLKFHPSLPKHNALLMGMSSAEPKEVLLSREQRAQQRYSVEVANAGSYLNIRPSTLETLTKASESSIQNRKYRKNAGENTNINEPNKLQSLPEMMPVCPPALRCLLFLWEQLCSNCIQAIQTNVADPGLKDELSKTLEDEDENVDLRQLKKIDDGTWCELCEIYLPIPVTYHMRMIHPGCGKSSKGKGFNSVGTYCEGWAGNCGEGGKGASSWYLMCDTCREKHIDANRNLSLNSRSSNASFYSVQKMAVMKSNFEINLDIYTTMKENAMFLLELCSSGPGDVMSNQKRSPLTMTVVNERHDQELEDPNKPSTSRAEAIIHSNRSSKYIQSNGLNAREMPRSTPYKKYDGITCHSPELVWQIPEDFSCLESLGASISNDAPYDMLTFADNSFDRPLSEISLDSVDTNNFGCAFPGPVGARGNHFNRFHRSLSMGQGLPAQGFGLNRPHYQQNAETFYDQSTKVVMRRRNNSTCDSDGSLLLCNPSENLRKLIPEEVFHTLNANTQHSQFKAPIASKFENYNSERKRGDATKVGLPVADSSENASTQHNDELIAKHNELEASRQKICLMSRPTLAFVLQSHNLEKLRGAMKRNLRVATCRIYALQAMNWLMRSVTHPTCLHDLMWWFVTSLNPLSIGDAGEQVLEHPISTLRMCGKMSVMLTQSFHSYLQTVADLTLLLPSGSSLQQLAIQCFGIKFRQADHHFLHQSHVFGNISKILSKSDEIREQAEDMSSIMINSHDPNNGIGPSAANAETNIQWLEDLSNMFEVTVSSRQSMAASLTDNSTETFWESDEEDRNRSKVIEMSLNKFDYVCRSIFVHIDNSRDIQNKITNVSFYGGHSLGDMVLLRTLDVSSKTGSWISAKIYDDLFTNFRIELKGSETIRVRQVKVLGHESYAENFAQKHHVKISNSHQIQQRNCETETLRVFRLITAQVFGKLILGDNSSSDDRIFHAPSVYAQQELESNTTSMLADSLDLREHMVGILFSRSKLSHLQKQVIVHIVYAIRKETNRAREEWESINNVSPIDPQTNCDQKSDMTSEHSRAPDVYCFEMLSMVLALSGSTVGRSYLSNQHGLLRDLLSLLHTGSDRVQRQVTALLRRILPEITPEQLADWLAVEKLPPSDFRIVSQSSIDFDMNRMGILDIFLAVIAKSLQLQVKIKSTAITGPSNKQVHAVRLCQCIDPNGCNGLSSPRHDAEYRMNMENVVKSSAYSNSSLENSHGADCDFEKYSKAGVSKPLNQRWFLKGITHVKQAENIIGLIRDMTNGKLTEKWSLVTKAAIAESILNLTRLEECYRTQENCVKTSTLWLALASLCVLDKDHVEKLSSGQWSKGSESRPLCTNHDDGVTPAVIQCETCCSLCADCDRFLHLNRKTRNHHRTVCKEEEEAIRVELHESCGRTKLFWLLALADSRTLKAVIEFRDGNNAFISGPSSSKGRCRFCGVVGDSGLLAMGNVCADAQCQEYGTNMCVKTKACGHACGGVANEQRCLPCLEVSCHKKENELAESIKLPKLTQDADDMCMICFVEALSCAPAVQLECGHVFHLHCCKLVLQKRWTGPRISFGFSQCPICKTDIAHPLLADLLELINRLKEDVKKKALMRLEYEGIGNTSSHSDMVAYAMDRYAYYVCFKCQKAYYGGEARCDAELGDSYNPQELVCGGCSDVARAQMCPKHGTDYLEYKCRYCCSVAVFFCFGTTHFCDTCHDDFQRLTNIPKHKLPKCPAGPKAKQILGEDCPLHVIHPPTGEEFALGCGICRNAQTF